MQCVHIPHLRVRRDRQEMSLMNRIAHAVLSRRNLIGGAGAGIATMTWRDRSVPNEETREHSTGERLTSSFAPESLVLAESTYFTQDRANEVTASLPTRVSLEPQKTPSMFSMTWDSRLFSVKQPAYCLLEDGSVQRRFDDSIDGTASFDVPEGTHGLVFRIEVLNAYPNENLSDVRRSTIAFEEGDSTTRAWTAEDRSSPSRPWGLEVKASWSCQQGIIVPALISVDSVGPFVAPAGVTVKADYTDVIGPPQLVSPWDEAPNGDRASARGLRDDALEGSSAMTIDTSVNEGVRQVLITIAEELAPGEGLVFASEVERSDSEPTTHGPFVPRISVSMPSSVTGARETGSSSLFPVTAAGTPASTYLSPTAVQASADDTREGAR